MIHASAASSLSQSISSAENQVVEYLMKYLNIEISHKCRNGFHSCSFEVPGFVWAMPRFDREQVIAMLREELGLLGYKVKRRLFCLKVSWKPQSVPIYKLSAQERELLPEPEEFVIEFNT